MQDLEGRVVFVTGGAGDHGLGTASALLRTGFRIALTDSDDDRLARAEKRLAAAGNPADSVCPIVLEVTDRRRLAEAADQVERRFGRIDALVHLAGRPVRGRVVDARTDDRAQALTVNLGGTVNAVQTLLPRIREHGHGGHIVLRASVAGLLPLPSRGTFSVAEHSIVGLGESLRADLIGTGVGVSILCLDHLTDTGTKLDSVSGAISPDVGEAVMEGICRNDLYVVADPGIRERIIAHFERLSAVCRSVPGTLAPAPPPSDRPGGAPSFGAAYGSTAEAPTPIEAGRS